MWIMGVFVYMSLSDTTKFFNVFSLEYKLVLTMTDTVHILHHTIMHVSSGKCFEKKLLLTIRSGDKEQILEVPFIERAQTSAN